jgi:Polyketide cyclase / dehydrase and lipid transport
MPLYQTFEQAIQIKASSTSVERCLTDLELMHRWLNPLLKCEPIGRWTTDIGGRSRFLIQIPVLNPTLKSVVVEREPGLIVWQFEGFFQGRDRWECKPNDRGTQLYNCFEFNIPNPIIGWGFNTFAANFTKNDMEAQLRRLKRVAEEIYLDEQ